jgi:hypothetical protein
VGVWSGNPAPVMLLKRSSLIPYHRIWSAKMFCKRFGTLRGLRKTAKCRTPYIAIEGLQSRRTSNLISQPFLGKHCWRTNNEYDKLPEWHSRPALSSDMI